MGNGYLPQVVQNTHQESQSPVHFLSANSFSCSAVISFREVLTQSGSAISEKHLPSTELFPSLLARIFLDVSIKFHAKLGVGTRRMIISYIRSLEKKVVIHIRGHILKEFFSFPVGDSERLPLVTSPSLILRWRRRPKPTWGGERGGGGTGETERGGGEQDRGK